MEVIDDPTACPVCYGGVVAGVEVQGVYDGVLIWECGKGHRWPRFLDGRLHDLAVKTIEKWGVAL